MNRLAEAYRRMTARSKAAHGDSPDSFEGVIVTDQPIDTVQVLRNLATSTGIPLEDLAEWLDSQIHVGHNAYAVGGMAPNPTSARLSLALLCAQCFCCGYEYRGLVDEPRAAAA